MCGTVWCGFVGLCVCCEWESLVWVCRSEIMLFLGQFGASLEE